MIWVVVGCSIFSSNIGAEHFIGLAGAGATDGIVVGVIEWISALILIAFAHFMVPVYLRSQVCHFECVFTEKRFT